jgi:hypothetical protein
MVGFGSIAKIAISSANVAVVRMEGRRCRGGKEQGHYFEGLLRELGEGLSICCQL